MKDDFLNKVDQETIVKAIEDAELGTSGEIRVHFEPKANEPVLDKAAETFALLHMHKTKLRNGVLIYIAYQDRSFAVIGDVGINKVVADNFWEKEKEILASHFKNQEFTKGVCAAIKGIAVILAKHFPYHDGLSGELPNEISVGE